MYNLFISYDNNSWNGEPFIIELGRCVREYTDTEITKKYGELSSTEVDALRRFPCIFAYENGCRKDPKFGVIRDITRRSGKARIEYEIINIGKFLTYPEIEEFGFELDISDWEMNRTHWAVKDVNLAKELKSRGIHLPYWACSTNKAVDITSHEFEVGLSFPGEIRGYIEPIVAELERNIGPNSYFYDNNYVSQLARPSLDVLLQDIYRNRSKLVVVFLCEKYQEKEWCGVEFRAIREIIMEKQDQKLMFVKMDDGKVEGVFKTDGYIDGRKFGPADVARFIQERVSLLLE